MIKTIKRVVIAIMGLTLMDGTSAYASHWVYVGTGTHNKLSIYYDGDTIQRSGSRVTVWMKVDGSQVTSVKWRENITLSRFDCALRTDTLISGVYYYPNGKAESFHLSSYEQTEYPIVPDSVSEAVLNAVCQ